MSRIGNRVLTFPENVNITIVDIKKNRFAVDSRC